jgi:hypothetical protein
VSVAVHEDGCTNKDVIGPRLKEAIRFWSVTGDMLDDMVARRMDFEGLQ